MGCETALADEFYFMPVFEIDVAAPCPCVRVRILFYYADEWLIAMGILNSIPLPVFWGGLHSATVVVVGGYSKRNARLCTKFTAFHIGLSCGGRTSLKDKGLFLPGK